ncbi:TniQ family protein [Streptomyces sp. NBC_01217]|uniref:TniQ family protein n=1 Tax=Streptomyces sp. NBC_01217 TaxID=2903779 RepID=UPI002E111B66|nr:TniQ family protein [Streptomyces sp. NBC_01217]WSQ63152.1 TniQ family protein [Streptomyces sp. NBC_01217]
MRPPARTLPIRLPPLPGEALDSWLEALARRLDTSLGEVLRHLGFPVRERSGNHLRDIPPDWTVLLNGQQTAAVAHASGLDEQTVTTLTLAHYDSRAARIDFQRRYVNRHVLWGRSRGSRFCPDCLRDTDGRWQLFWRLGWAFACPRHGRLLADCCPQCGRIPRQRPRSGRVVPHPGVCGNPSAHQDGRGPGGCGFDFSRTHTLWLPAAHPALAAQEKLRDVIESGTAAFGTYAISPQQSQTALADVRAIGGRVLADLPEHVARSLVPADIAEEHFTPDPGSRLALRATERPGFMAPPRAASIAVGAIIALHVLDQPDIHQAGAAMRGLLEAMRDELWQITSTSIDSWGRGLSPVLKGVQLAALAPSLRPSEHIRYCTPTDLPRRPGKTSQDIAQRARKIPSTFWKLWTTRLVPSDGVYPRTLAPVLAAMLLTVDSRTTFEEAAAYLGGVTDRIDISRILQMLDDQPHWPDTVRALVRLADHLDAVHVPVDYRRRRGLDYTNLLPTERWLEICRRTDTSPGSGRRERIARSHLFQRISGLPLEAAPDHQRLNEAEFRAQAARFAAVQTPKLAEALAYEARIFLAEHRIRDEPVTWHPPATLLSGLELPGPDPAHIDVSRLHRLVRQHKNPVQYAADVLGTSIEAVRHILDERPAPEPPPKSTVRPMPRIRMRARQEVPPDTFSRLYLDEHRSLDDIAELTGFSRKVLTALAREYGVSLRSGNRDYRRRGVVEKDWLTEQYVVHRRTLADLAREKDMSPTNMARWAHTHNIPLRSPGGRSHHTALRATDHAEE